jgi:hypothetical protein
LGGNAVDSSYSAIPAVIFYFGRIPGSAGDRAIRSNFCFAKIPLLSLARLTVEHLPPKLEVRPLNIVYHKLKVAFPKLKFWESLTIYCFVSITCEPKSCPEKLAGQPLFCLGLPEGSPSMEFIGIFVVRKNYPKTSDFGIVYPIYRKPIFL